MFFEAWRFFQLFFFATLASITDFAVTLKDLNGVIVGGGGGGVGGIVSISFLFSCFCLKEWATLFL